jgi:allantoinase
MKADLEIYGGEIVTPHYTKEGIIYVEDGKIVAITQERIAQAKKSIDATGLHVIPGAIDGHVHMMDPGFTDREDFLTGTTAAARGGMTTIIEHHRHAPPTLDANILKDKIDYFSTRSNIDYSLMGGIQPHNIDKAQEMWQHGAVSFKGFTCELHGQAPLLEGELYELFTLLAKIGGMALIHCESDSLTRWDEKRLKELGRKDPLAIQEWRSPLAEVLAVRNVAYLAQVTGAKVVVAHVSQPEVLREIRRARSNGANIYAETCTQYLSLSTEDLIEKGPFAKFTPPPREPEIVQEMWTYLNAGYVDIVSSDHCPHCETDKIIGLKDIWDAPFGIPGVELSLRMMLDGVSKGKTTLQKVVQLMCENPARLYGLYPKKGVLEVGADADIVLLDMNFKEVITKEGILSKCGWSPYEGKEVTGSPITTIVRGNIIMENLEMTDVSPVGEFISRQEAIQTTVKK